MRTDFLLRAPDFISRGNFPKADRHGVRDSLFNRGRKDFTDLPVQPGWNLGLLATPLFTNRRQHTHYYPVVPQYAAATRFAYVGVHHLATLPKRIDLF
ncbi:MAG TPA: hypothetical protein PLB97_05490 [Accumulibacter sp.]|jgi:hypothetical protein|nr:hypothetical protein [Accumulibacter sp.]